MMSTSRAFRILISAAIMNLCIISFFSFCKSNLGGRTSATIAAMPITTPASSVISSSIFAIPEYFWYELGSKGLNNQSRKWIDACLEKNPTYTPGLLIDVAGDITVKELLRTDLKLWKPTCFPNTYFKSRLFAISHRLCSRRDMERSRSLVRRCTYSRLNTQVI